MVKLIGSKNVIAAVFISGTGSNLKSLIKFSLLKRSPIKINLVISNNTKAKGLNFAEKYKSELVFGISKRLKTIPNKITYISHEEYHDEPLKYVLKNPIVAAPKL